MKLKASYIFILMILLTSTYSCVSVKAQGDNIITEGQAVEIAKKEAKILGYDVE